MTIQEAIAIANRSTKAAEQEAATWRDSWRALSIVNDELKLRAESAEARADALAAELELTADRLAVAEVNLNNIIDAKMNVEAELAALRLWGQWQPIESAPTTKLIHVIDMTAAAPVPMTATQKQKGVWSTLPGYYNIHPTHWQPLPAPPVGSARAGEKP